LSHLQLGKIFDVTGQRDRAVNEYRQALQTNDNTQGALDECRRYMQNPSSGKKKEKETRQKIWSVPPANSGTTGGTILNIEQLSPNVK